MFYLYFIEIYFIVIVRIWYALFDEKGGDKLMKKRNFLIIAVPFLILFGSALFILRPLSFDNYSGQTFQITYVQDNIEVHDFAAIPSDIVYTNEITLDNAGYQSLIDSLSSAKFTRCFHTPNSTYFPEGYCENFIRISWPTTSVYLCKNSSHIVVNGVLYRQTSSFNLYGVCQEVMNMIER